MKKILIASFLLIAISPLQAQEYKTSESIKSQILNGTVPGAQFSKQTAQKTTALREEKTQGTVSAGAIKTNKVAGWQYSTGGTTATATPGSGRKKEPVLPSEAVAEKEPAKKPQPAEHKIPSQEKTENQ